MYTFIKKFEDLAEKSVTYGKFVESIRNSKHDNRVKRIVRLTPNGQKKLERRIDSLIFKDERAYTTMGLGRNYYIEGVMKTINTLIDFLYFSEIGLERSYCCDKRKRVIDFSDLVYGKDFVITISKLTHLRYKLDS